MDQGKIGIDAGGTLIKIVYEENGNYRYRKHSYGEAESVLNWLKMTAPYAHIAVTGGRAEWVRRNFFPNASSSEEFKAVTSGAAFLHQKENDALPGSFLLVNIGTGTSILLAGDGKYERLGGSGLGGGTLTGLGELLAGTSDFEELVILASLGDRKKADLLIKDIYSDGGEPLNGELTASNFAQGKKASREDISAALFNMISETLVLLSSQLAAVHNVKTIVFAGSTLSGNEPLRDSLGKYTTMFGLEPAFLNHGEYCGAVGALLDN